MSKPKRLTPEEARALVEKHGSQQKAADAYGVPRPTLQYWLDPEPQKARVRERYRANPEKALARNRKWWDELSGPAYSRRLLNNRRSKALRRMAERKRRRTEEAT